MAFAGAESGSFGFPVEDKLQKRFFFCRFAFKCFFDMDFNEGNLRQILCSIGNPKDLEFKI